MTAAQDQWTKVKGDMSAMLEVLAKCSEDKGLMARLRAGLRETTQSQAWPFLIKFCDLNEYNLLNFNIFRTIAGLFAMHPSQSEKNASNNMGTLCRKLCSPDESQSLNATPPKDGPMAKRLKHLLDSDRNELCDRVIRIALYAHSKGVPIDYKTLGEDLLFWGDGVRRRWAQSFWGYTGTKDDKEVNPEKEASS